MMVSMTNLTDSLRRDDMRPAAIKPTRTKLVKRYAVLYTTSSGDRRTSRRVYPRAYALKLAARLNQLSDNRADAYASALMIRVTVEVES